MESRLTYYFGKGGYASEEYEFVIMVLYQFVENYHKNLVWERYRIFTGAKMRECEPQLLPHGRLVCVETSNGTTEGSEASQSQRN